jgi:hypothetical protein
MLFVCERILWSVTRTIPLLPHHVAFDQPQRHTTLGAFQSVLHSQHYFDWKLVPQGSVMNTIAAIF